MAFKRGDFSARLPDDWTGIAGKIADTFNKIIGINQRLTKELARISRVVGKEGRIRQRASLGEVSGSWEEAMGSINNLIEDLVQPTSEMARVIGAVAKGDLSQNMATEIEGRALKGDFLRTAKLVNAMVNQLSAFASEGYARCAGGRDRRQAGRPGQGERRCRHLERFDRERQSDGR
jgi:HAMP domain-containing protein